MFSNISLLIWKYSQGFGDPVTYKAGYTNHRETQTQGLFVLLMCLKLLSFITELLQSRTLPKATSMLTETFCNLVLSVFLLFRKKTGGWFVWKYIPYSSICFIEKFTWNMLKSERWKKKKDKSSLIATYGQKIPQQKAVSLQVSLFTHRPESTHKGCNSPSQMGDKRYSPG